MCVLDEWYGQGRGDDKCCDTLADNENHPMGNAWITYYKYKGGVMRLRKGRRTRFSRIMDMLALFPWWASVLIAFFSYLTLHDLSLFFAHSLVTPVAHGPGGPLVAALGPRLVGNSMGYGLTHFFQYILPLLFVIGAFYSVIRGRQARVLVAQAQDSLTRIHSMSWQQFERLLGQVFREQGYHVRETGGGGADGGVDLILSRDGERTLVQCKHWKTRKVGVTVVREMYGLLVAHGAQRVKVVTSGVFSAEAQGFAQGKPIDLVGRTELAQWLGHRVDDQSAEAAPLSPDLSVADPVPLCPQCGQLMRRRQAKTASGLGQHFWGCSQFPRCRGTRAC